MKALNIFKLLTIVVFVNLVAIFCYSLPVIGIGQWPTDFDQVVGNNYGSCGGVEIPV